MICFLDMDGILANFVKGALTFYKRLDIYDNYPKGNFNIQKILDMDYFWPAIDNYNFWNNLEKMSDADKIVKFCLSEFDTVYIATSPSLNCHKAKVDWIYKYYPRLLLKIIFIHDKWLLANEFSLLIDDNDDNVDLFASHGGYAYLYPRPWNRAHAERPDLRSIPCLQS